MLFWPSLGHFWCSVVTLLPFSSNLSSFEKRHKKCQKNRKKKHLKKSQKIGNNSLFSPIFLRFFFKIFVFYTKKNLYLSFGIYGD